MNSSAVSQSSAAAKTASKSKCDCRAEASASFRAASTPNLRSTSLCSSRHCWYGSDADLHGDPADSLEKETDSEWSDAIEALKSRKGKLDRLTKERKIALDEFNEARNQLFQLLDSNNTDTYTTNDYIVRKITRKGRVSYKGAMFELCGGERDLFNYYSDKHRGKSLNTLSIRAIQKTSPR